MDRPDQPRAHQPRHRPRHARRGLAVRVRAPPGWGRAVAPAGEHVLLRAARRLACLLLLDALPRLPRRGARRPPGSDPGGGGGGDRAAPVPDHGLGDRDVRRVLAAARGRGAVRLARSVQAPPVRARGVRRARGRDAAGPGAGGAARERGPRPRRRGGGRDREPARPAEHARGPDAAADRDRARLARAARRILARAAGALGIDARPGRDGRVLRRGRRVLGRRGAPGRRRALFRGSGLGEPAVGGARPRAGSARRARRLQRLRLRGLADDLPPAGGRASDPRGGAARLHGQDPDARGSPQPGRPRRLRAAARADGLPGSGVAVRRVPVHGVDPAARGPGAHVGGDPGRVQPLRPRAVEGAGLGRRARLAAADGARLLGARSTEPTRGGARSSRGARPEAARGGCAARRATGLA